MNMYRIRREKGLTMEQVAARAGISVSAAWRCEKGQVSTQLGTLRKIAKALGVPLKELIGDE